MTLFEALTGGAFDRLNWQHSGEFDQNFSKKSNARGLAQGGMGGFGIDRYITEALCFILQQCFTPPYVWCSLRLLQLKTEGQTISTEHLAIKLQN